MITSEHLGLLFRVLAALVWTALFVIRMRQSPARRSVDLRLKVVDFTLVVITWAFVYGAIVNLGIFTRDSGTLLYTVVAMGIFVVGVALFTLRDEL